MERTLNTCIRAEQNVQISTRQRILGIIFGILITFLMVVAIFYVIAFLVAWIVPALGLGYFKGLTLVVNLIIFPFVGMITEVIKSFLVGPLQRFLVERLGLSPVVALVISSLIVMVVIVVAAWIAKQPASGFQNVGWRSHTTKSLKEIVVVVWTGVKSWFVLSWRNSFGVRRNWFRHSVLYSVLSTLAREMRGFKIWRSGQPLTHNLLRVSVCGLVCYIVFLVVGSTAFWYCLAFLIPFVWNSFDTSPSVSGEPEARQLHGIE